LKEDGGKLALYLAHWTALVNYARPIVGDPMQAEDVVQEAFIRFMPDAGAGGKIEQPVAYLYRIVRNLAFDWTRRRAGEHRQEQADPAWWVVPTVPRTPEQELIHQQDLDRVETILSDLPPPVRLAVEMHRFGGYTLQEIADRLGISVATAHRQVRQALMRIALQVTPPDERSDTHRF
jgi:RNA polymerase sigma-70 factor (ECF subfamily)